MHLFESSKYPSRDLNPGLPGGKSVALLFKLFVLFVGFKLLFNERSTSKIAVIFMFQSNMLSTFLAKIFAFFAFLKIPFFKEQA